MANSLEVRSPYLDHELIELAINIPSQLKIKNNINKYILRRSFMNILPDEILNAKKRGFSVPLNNWFQSSLKQYCKDILFDAKALSRGYFKKESLERLIKEEIDGSSNHGARLWSLIALELWHKEYVDNVPVFPSHEYSQII